jgi:glycosyltransferase involved in cell wall biosynthesis
VRFSVITVCFNSEATIGDTLKSVAGQDWPDFEHIVVDGASSDGTMAEVEAHRHPRLHALSEPDGGIYDAMNKGLSLASGDYVQFLNSDDFLSRADALSLVASRIAESGADCIFADTRFVVGLEARPGARLYSARRFRRWWLRIGAMPPHPSSFVKRDLMLKLGGFDTDYAMAADFDLIARALLREKASWAALPSALVAFRSGGVSTAGLAAKMALSREFARSLARLGQPLASLCVLLRFPLKLSQLRPFKRRGEPPSFFRRPSPHPPA